MRRRVNVASASLAVALFVLSLGAASAQTRGLTAMGGYQFGGSFEEPASGAEIEIDEAPNVTLLLNLPYERDSELEFLFSRQSTSLLEAGQFTSDKVFDLDIYYVHVGGLVLVNPDRVEPYVAGGVGFTHMTPGRSGLSSETRLSLSLGGGVRVPMSQRLVLRFDVRGFLTLFDSDGAVFCSGGNCNVTIASDAFWQTAANAGIEFRF